jgi:hypothetical protein
MKLLAGWFALALAALAPASLVQAAARPILLKCTFDNYRTIGGIVVMQRLKKLRIWYGDGGGEEWSNVDFTRPWIATTVQDGRSLVLSKDFHHVVFNDAEEKEHAKGRCSVASLPRGLGYWVAPLLRQPNNR